MTVRMRHTKGHTGNRRSHHALSGQRLSTCVTCGSQYIRHQVCQKCGSYRGRTVVDVQAKDNRALVRKQAKLRARGENAAAAAKDTAAESKDSK